MAKSFYSDSLEALEEAGDLKSIAYAANNLGDTYRFLKNFDKALEFLKLSLKIRIKIGESENIAYSWINLAELFIDKKDYNTALKLIYQSLNIFSFLKNRNGLNEVNALLNSIIKEIGEVNFQNKFLAIKQSVDKGEKFDISKL